MKKRNYQKFSGAEVQMLIKLNKQGLSNKDIGSMLGKSAIQVAQKKSQLGITKGQDLPSSSDAARKHKRRWTAAEILSLKQMYYKRGVNVSVISETLGRTEQSILNKIRDLEKMPDRYEETSLLWGMVKFKYPAR
jgi:biotin operon repressor